MTLTLIAETDPGLRVNNFGPVGSGHSRVSVSIFVVSNLCCGKLCTCSLELLQRHYSYHTARVTGSKTSGSVTSLDPVPSLWYRLLDVVSICTSIKLSTSFSSSVINSDDTEMDSSWPRPVYNVYRSRSSIRLPCLMLVTFYPEVMEHFHFPVSALCGFLTLTFDLFISNLLNQLQLKPSHFPSISGLLKFFVLELGIWYV